MILHNPLHLQAELNKSLSEGPKIRKKLEEQIKSLQLTVTGTNN